MNDQTTAQPPVPWDADEHQPGHPISKQPGPGGQHARWCRICPWRDVIRSRSGR